MPCCGAYQTGVAAGVLLTYGLGKFADWTQLALWCAMPPAVALLLLWMAVESPRWLFENAQPEEAQKALRILRGKVLEADTEYEEIEAIYVKTPTPLIHYMLAVLVIMVQQFSGVNNLILYASSPLHAGFGYASDDTLLLLSSLQFATTAVAAQLLDAVGRVKPLAVSVVVSAGSMVALGGVYFGVSHDEEALDTHIAARITVVCKVIFTIGFSLGLGPASWTLAVELAPLRKNGFEFGSVCAFHWASALGIISLFTILGTTTGSLALLVSLTGLVTFAGGMTAFKLLPDTRGVSLEGILLQGQGDVCSRKASDIVDAVKPADALPQVPKNDHEDQTATRDEQKTRPQRKDSAPHSSVGVSLKGSSKPKAKAQAKSHARPQAKAESKAKSEAKPQPEAGAKAGATEAVASGEDEVKSDVPSGATLAIVSPAKRAPGQQELTDVDEEG
ncbi:facilitated trehalose transporter Tret1-like [Rhipicephalus sanguineus]|uniref:facilitated trehalose transporter Tret1-like n=1 Tax=Rhipicephalus sanguineus TaxID=34632 RepID=UPI0020C2AEF4|nr:facilitated trehalose transporter Tret1-like [Rhipicephalus sanguineus]